MAGHWLSISDFSARSRLSPKALRLYDEIGLLGPAHVDPSSGYRWYAPEQLHRARQVALLRFLQMPLAQIGQVLELPGPAAAEAVRGYWSGVEQAVEGRRAAAAYLCAVLEGGSQSMERTYEVALRTIAGRALLSGVRHVHEAQAGAVLGTLLGRMRGAGPGLPGIEGCPYLTYFGVVSADSDGPVEVARPVADLASAEQAAQRLGDIQARLEGAHDEAFVTLTMAELGWPAQLPALDAVEAYVRDLGREPAGAPRQVMIADWRTAGPDTPACDLAVPLRPAAAA